MVKLKKRLSTFVMKYCENLKNKTIVQGNSNHVSFSSITIINSFSYLNYLRTLPKIVLFGKIEGVWEGIILYPSEYAYNFYAFDVF